MTSVPAPMTRVWVPSPSFDSVSGSAQNPLTLNRYLYANANPATMVDPDGHAARNTYYESAADPSASDYAKYTGKLVHAAIKKWLETETIRRSRIVAAEGYNLFDPVEQIKQLDKECSERASRVACEAKNDAKAALGPSMLQQDPIGTAAFIAAGLACAGLCGGILVDLAAGALGTGSGILTAAGEAIAAFTAAGGGSEGLQAACFAISCWQTGPATLSQLCILSGSCLGGETPTMPKGAGPAVGGAEGATTRLPTITGFTRHGINQAISNDGVGVSERAMLDAVANPTKVERLVDGFGRESVRYTGSDAVVVLNLEGEVVTTWALTKNGWRIGSGK